MCFGNAAWPFAPLPAMERKKSPIMRWRSSSAYRDLCGGSKLLRGSANGIGGSRLQIAACAVEHWELLDWEGSVRQSRCVRNLSAFAYVFTIRISRQGSRRRWVSSAQSMWKTLLHKVTFSACTQT